MRTGWLLFLVACSYTLDDQRVGGDRRIGHWLDEMMAEVCRCEEGNDKLVCEATFRANTATARANCRIRWDHARGCLAQLREASCPDPLASASCFDVFPRCDVFLGDRDSGFDEREDSSGG